MTKNTYKEHDWSNNKFMEYSKTDAKKREKITAMIEAAQSRARSRKITIDDVDRAINRFENEIRITLKQLNGSWFRYDANAQIFPQSYKYKCDAESTIILVEYKNGKRYVFTCRGRCYSMREQYSTTLTDTAKKAIIDSFKEF